MKTQSAAVVTCVALLAASGALAQPMVVEVPASSLTSGPITTIAPGTATTPMWASPADAATFWKRDHATGLWEQRGIPTTAQPRNSPFIPTKGAILTNFGANLFYSPRGNGIWRSPLGDAAFTTAAGVPVYNGWDLNNPYRWNAAGFAQANGTLYAAMGRDEGNSSNGHSSSWLLLGSAGVLRSTDGGSTWTQFSTGLPAWGSDEFFGQTREPIKNFAAIGNTLLLETIFEKVYRSVNNGAWEQIANRGGLPTYITNLRLADLSGWINTPRGIIAIVRGEGLFLSTDNASTFNPAPSIGLPTRPDIRTFIDTPDGLFIAVSPPATTQFVTPPIKLYRSTDAGASFRRHGAPIASGITALAYRAGQLYIGTGAEGLVSLSTTTCMSDIASAGGAIDPDGTLSADDVITYLAAFFANNLAIADLASVGGSTSPDNQLTSDDLIAFLGSFFAGCNG